MVIYRNIHNTHRPTKSSLTLVIKVGTSSICDEKTHYPLLGNLSRIVETILQLKNMGHRVVLVTSAAVGTGLRRLNMNEKPKKLSGIQAIAAVGQGRLMSMYDDLFGQFNQPVAQILLTRNDLADRSQYLNAVNCLEQLLDMSVVPIVNENDTISVSEIKFGDNDTLSAITAGMVKADYLFLMTDVDCLYTDNPRTNPKARPVLECDDIEALREEITVTSPGSSLGTGGMVTKLVAADLATAAGVTTVITRGATPENIIPIIAADDNQKVPLHTRFVAKPQPLIDRKWWILHGLHTAGTVVIDADVAGAIANGATRQGASGASLYAHSVKRVEGHFVEHQAVRLVVQHTTADDVTDFITVAKGIVNYSSAEIVRIMRAQQNDIVDSLGYGDADCIIHRDNMAISI
ncbi:glutamate 5-kinase [Radiomyces spectabilis]|uniref:glutamate 5-kinase n=1 Tax=Radiomyces spectabilis TaxID=64574 RepID=UPI00221ED990|nr:glutamate 5-kinase [Radiomyces spectabilis]KAI8376024.1 glutamate 5-kinase [Radiomyces spectabilis]